MLVSSTLLLAEQTLTTQLLLLDMAMRVAKTTGLLETHGEQAGANKDISDLQLSMALRASVVSNSKVFTHIPREHVDINDSYGFKDQINFHKQNNFLKHKYV